MPIVIERLRHLRHDIAHCQSIQIGKQHAIGRAKILIAHIATTDDGSGIVGSEAFVVHAPIGAVEFGDKTKQFERAKHKRVEQAHFNIRVGIQSRQGLIQATGTMVV